MACQFIRTTGTRYQAFWLGLVLDVMTGLPGGVKSTPNAACVGDENCTQGLATPAALVTRACQWYVPFLNLVASTDANPSAGIAPPDAVCFPVNGLPAGWTSTWGISPAAAWKCNATVVTLTHLPVPSAPLVPGLAIHREVGAKGARTGVGDGVGDAVGDGEAVGVAVPSACACSGTASAREIERRAASRAMRRVNETSPEELLKV